MIGGTYTIYFWPMIQGYGSGYGLKYGTNVPPSQDPGIPIDSKKDHITNDSIVNSDPKIVHSYPSMMWCIQQ